MLAVVTSLSGLVVVSASPAAAAVAAGCTSARPTRIGGPVYGVDGRSLNVLVGIDLVNADLKRVDADGRLINHVGYLYVEHLNRTIPAEGSTDTRLTRRWTGMCVSTKVARLYLEMYPKNPSGVTTKSRYGSAANHAHPITAGARNDILLRLPLARPLGGKVGWVRGDITVGGKPVPDLRKVVVRVFPRRPGHQCGIEGFSASADVLRTKADGTTTYYRADHIAGGRCGEPNQLYDVRVTYNGVVKRGFVYVTTGRGVTFSAAF